MDFRCSRVVVNPRGNKLRENEAISIIIDVDLSRFDNKQFLKEVFLNREVHLIEAQYCCLVELIHVITQPDSSIREMNTMTMITMIGALSSLQCFSVWMHMINESR